MKYPGWSGLALFFAFVSSLAAQTLTQLRDTGPRASRVNIVFLAEGYVASESAKFISDAHGFVATIVTDPAFLPFSDQINAFGIFVASNESGADDPATNTVRDTYFNATFNTGGIDRLLTIAAGVQGFNKATALLNQFVPDWDIVVILVNSTKYGGAGGTYTTTSLHTASPEILLHEIGHSFAKLTDEYVDLAAAPSYPARESTNATQQTTRANIPWGLFVQESTVIPTPTPNPVPADENTVGLFLGAHYRDTGFYRPTYNNKMRSLSRPWGPVNIRAFSAEIHRLNINRSTARPTITRQPESINAQPGQSATLSVTATGVGPLTYQWRHNGKYLPTGMSDTLTFSALNGGHAGTYSVEVTNATGTTTSTEAQISLPSGAVIIAPLPASTVGILNQNLTLSVSAAGQAPLTYQWRREGVDIPGATNVSYTIALLTTTLRGNYTVAVTNSFGTVISNATAVSIAAPLFATHPASTTAIEGSPVALSVSLQNPSGVAVSWRKNGVAISGATGLTLTLPSTQVSDSASYTAVATNSFGTTISNAGVLTVSSRSSAQPSWIANISVMTSLAAGEDFSMGYVVGNASTGDPKALVIRAAGPSLQTFGMTGLLGNPQIQLYSDSRATTLNNNWDGVPAVANAMAAVGAFPFINGSSLDSAVAASVTTRSNSVLVSSLGSTSGTVLAEVYDATPAPAFTTARPRLVNVSVMKNIGSGLTVGFVIGPPGSTTPRRILVRAIGPTLGSLFGLGNVVANPQMTLFGANSTEIATNDNWGGTAALTTAFNSVGAFGLPANSQDAALTASLVPGNYSVVVTGVGGSGTALVEVYELP